MSATPKQIDLIEALFIKKAIPEPIRAQTRALYQRADQKPVPHIRELIDGMYALPDAPRPAAAAAPAYERTDALIRRLEVPKSRYAIRTTDLPSPALKDLAHQNSLLFCEVKEFKDTLYIRVLRGAPGNFNREKIDRALANDLVRHISTDPYEHARLFGEHYSCCGSCGAELTDDTSRALQLGPECRKKFGR